MRRFFVGTVVIAAVLASSGCAQAQNDPTASTYTLLDDAASQLRDDFNRATGSVRLVFVVDPICPVCLRGLDVLNKALLATTDDSRLQTFVVHVPVLGAQSEDVAPSMQLLRNPHVRHYWNPTGEFGRSLAKAVGLKRGDELVYAWDVWLIYDAAAEWEGVSPPRPRRLMHQLPALKKSTEFPRLDAGAFASEVRQLLAQLPAAGPGQ